jgi:hypothetical protein
VDSSDSEDDGVTDRPLRSDPVVGPVLFQARASAKKQKLNYSFLHRIMAEESANMHT